MQVITASPDGQAFGSGLAQSRQDEGIAAWIVQLVALATGVPALDILSATRHRADAARARQIAIYLAHTGCAWPLARVGIAFGRDRSTCAHACARVEDMREDARFDTRLAGLEACVRTVPDAGLWL